MAKKQTRIITTRSRSKAMRQQQSQITPAIHRLPLEILQLVLILSVPDSQVLQDELCGPTTCYYRELLQLCGVSWRWASFIRNTPSFWEYTSQADCDELTAAILSRSKNYPLQVRYIVHEELGCACQENASYLRPIVAQSHRWHRLEVSTANRRVVEVFLAAGAPQLQYLQVSNQSEHLVPMTIQIGGGYRLPGLRSLQLRQVVPGPTLVQLIDVIENSPNLHILAIFESEVAIASHEVQNMKRPTLTPGMLDALKLSGLSPEATCALLSCLTIHNQSNFLLNVSLVLNRDEAEAIMAFAFRHVGSLSPSYFEVKISDRRYTLNHEWEEWYIALSSVEGDATEDFVHVVNDRLTKAVPELHNVQATLRIDMEVVDLLPIMSVMDNLLDITALVLIAPLQISVLKPLSRPLSSGRWLLPNLEDLTICPYDTLVDSTLPQMIRARWKASDKKKHGDSNPGVIPIDTVYIDGEGEITQEAQTWLATTKLIQHFYIDSDKILIA